MTWSNSITKRNLLAERFIEAGNIFIYFRDLSPEISEEEHPPFARTATAASARTSTHLVKTPFKWGWVAKNEPQIA